MKRVAIMVMICATIAGCGDLRATNSDDGSATPGAGRDARTPEAGGRATSTPDAVETGTPKDADGATPPGDETPAFVPDAAATGTALVAGTVPSGPSDETPYPEPATATFPPNEPIGTPPLPTATLAPSTFPRVGVLKPLSFSDGPYLAPGDLAVRGRGTPGRGVFLGERLIIPAIYVDAGVRIVNVGPDGVMPSPDSVQEVLWYDFSNFAGLGGLPGAGGNAIFAGDVAQPGEGAGVFVQLILLQPGAAMQLRLTDGQTLYYRVEFNKKVVAAEADWAAITGATADDSMTIITGAGMLTERRILWARRVDAP